MAKRPIRTDEAAVEDPPAPPDDASTRVDRRAASEDDDSGLRAVEFDASDPLAGGAIDPRVGVDGVEAGMDDPIADPSPVDGLLRTGDVSDQFDLRAGVEGPGIDLPGGSGLGLSDAGVDLPPGVDDGRQVPDGGSVDVPGMPDGGSALSDGNFGSGAPTMPTVEDLTASTRPATPTLDEMRSKATTIKLDDGSFATHAKNPAGGEGGWIVETPGGDILEGQDALDHIGQHLPLEPIPTEDHMGPEVDPEWRQEMMDSFEESTHYTEIQIEALKNAEVNPDPMSDGDLGDGSEPDTDIFEPEFDDPADAPLEMEAPIDAPPDPGNIDPVEF